MEREAIPLQQEIGEYLNKRHGEVVLKDLENVRRNLD